MPKQIKDYLHFHLGCSVSLTGCKSTVGILVGINIETQKTTIKKTSGECADYPMQVIRPNLRTYDQMTAAERKLVFDTDDAGDVTDKILNLHIDRFGLIEEGIANKLSDGDVFANLKNFYDTNGKQRHQ